MNIIAVNPPSNVIWKLTSIYMLFAFPRSGLGASKSDHIFSGTRDIFNSFVLYVLLGTRKADEELCNSLLDAVLGL